MGLQRPFLLGDQIYLRPLDREDLGERYLHWINDEEVTQHLASGRFPTRLEDLEEYYDNVVKSRDYVFFAILEKSDNRHVGNIKLGPIDWVNRTTNFGTMIGEKDVWGKGYGTEAMKLILRYAFDTLNMWKVWDAALATNLASLRKNEKAGLKVEATLHEEIYREGVYHDKVIVSITRKEYYSPRQP